MPPALLFLGSENTVLVLEPGSLEHVALTGLEALLLKEDFPTTSRSLKLSFEAPFQSQTSSSFVKHKAERVRVGRGLLSLSQPWDGGWGGGVLQSPEAPRSSRVCGAFLKHKSESDFLCHVSSELRDGILRLESPNVDHSIF